MCKNKLESEGNVMKLNIKEISPAKEISSPVVVCSVEWIASINPNIISAKPHKLFINNK